MPIEGAAEGVGWGLVLSISVTLVTSALGIGANNARNKRTAKDVEELKKEHAGEIAKIREASDQVEKDLAAYQLYVEREYPRKSDLAQMEARLGTKIDEHKRDLFQKVDEIKIDIGKRGIEHAIKNALAAALAGHTLQAKGKLPG